MHVLQNRNINVSYKTLYLAGGPSGKAVFAGTPRVLIDRAKTELSGSIPVP